MRFLRRGITAAEAGVAVYTNWDEFVPVLPGKDADDAAAHHTSQRHLVPVDKLARHLAETG